MSGKGRIGRYFQNHMGKVVTIGQLREVSGIHALFALQRGRPRFPAGATVMVMASEPGAPGERRCPAEVVGVAPQPIRRVRKMTTAKPPALKVSDGVTQDWSKVLKGATPEAVAKALLQPQKPLKPPAK